MERSSNSELGSDHPGGGYLLLPLGWSAFSHVIDRQSRPACAAREERPGLI